MKVYTIEQSGHDHHSVLGVYDSRESAEKDMEFIAQEEIRTSIGDDTFQERWVKFEDKWKNESRHKSSEEPWPEWPTFTKDSFSFSTIYIVEYETQNISLQDKVDAIKAWQTNGFVHPLTCGNDSSHPDLEPYYDFCWYGVGLQCVHKIDEDTWCGWKQKPDHPILEIVYASFFSNRPQTS